MTGSLVTQLSASGELGPNVNIGWANRAMVVAFAAWLVTTAWATRRAIAGKEAAI
jgi:hypothetical protein